MWRARCREDITPANTIQHDRNAEAVRRYGGRGQITDVQQPRYGAEVPDIILPYWPEPA